MPGRAGHVSMAQTVFLRNGNCANIDYALLAYFLCNEGTGSTKFYHIRDLTVALRHYELLRRSISFHVGIREL